MPAKRRVVARSDNTASAYPPLGSDCRYSAMKAGNVRFRSTSAIVYSPRTTATVRNVLEIRADLRLGIRTRLSVTFHPAPRLLEASVRVRRSMALNPASIER